MSACVELGDKLTSVSSLVPLVAPNCNWPSSRPIKGSRTSKNQLCEMSRSPMSLGRFPPSIYSRPFVYSHKNGSSRAISRKIQSLLLTQPARKARTKQIQRSKQKAIKCWGRSGDIRSSQIDWNKKVETDPNICPAAHGTLRKPVVVKGLWTLQLPKMDIQLALERRHIKQLTENDQYTQFPKMIISAANSPS